MKRTRPVEPQKHTTLVNLPNNLRFYVLMSAFGLSVLILCWLRLHIPSDRLFYIRAQQVFGFVALGYWYVALLASPLSKIFGKKGRMQYFLFARRAVGVAAAYFALLHTVIAFWEQIGGLSGFGLLPDRFKWSLVFGLVGLMVLIAMAITSFDKAVKFMTFRHWKRLHRVGYLAGVLTLLHAWMIATHLNYYGVQLTFTLMLILLSWLEAFRITHNLCVKYKTLKEQQQMVMLLIWGVCLLALFSVPKLVKNYHQEHHSATTSGEHQHE